MRAFEHPTAAQTKGIKRIEKQLVASSFRSTKQQVVATTKSISSQPSAKINTRI